MAATHEQNVARVNELLQTGERLDDMPPDDLAVGMDLYHEWKRAVQSVILRLFGREHPHYVNFENYVEHRPGAPDVRNGLGILRAVKADVDAQT